jgi:hypothetical protein
MVTDHQEAEIYERCMSLETGCYGFPEGGRAMNKTWRLYVRVVCTDVVCHAHGT